MQAEYISAAFDPSRSELFADDSWEPVFRQLRESAPVHFCSTAATGPFWSVTRHRDIKAVDTNHADYSSEVGGIAIEDPAADDPMPVEAFIQMDPPRHEAQRGTVAAAVGPRAIGGMEDLIRTRAADILDHLPLNETFNWVDLVSKELTARMLATLFDFPYEQRQKLVYWSDVVTSAPGVQGSAAVAPEQRMAVLGDVAQTFMGLWQQRRENPGDDLISMMATSAATQSMESNPAEFLGNIVLLMTGGNDTTRNTISGGVLGLNQFPEEYEKLEADPRLIPNMVAEMIRWQSPVIHMRRTAVRDCELAGNTIRKGDKVVMWYLSGNRDESVFPDADRLIIDRDNARQHVAFGYGIHRCMGNRLAEMQLRVLWEEILNRFRRVEVTGPVVRVQSNFLRGIAELPVRLVR